jgi:peptide deformylase
MSVKKIFTIPDPILKKKSLPIKNVDSSVKKLMDDMLETMYAAPGIGLAAVQVGVLKRVVVIDLSKKEEKTPPLFFVNEEGCLSIPNQFAEIKRPKRCHVKYLDYNGKKKDLKADGLLATCIQHEIDHLNGILFIDYLSKLKKDLILKKVIKQKKEIDRVIV